MMHIKKTLLLIGKSCLCGGSGFPFSLSEWSLTICPTPYNRKYNVLIASLNKTLPSFDDAVAKPSAKRLVGTGFASRYRSQGGVGF